MGGACSDGEIPLLPTSLCLVREREWALRLLLDPSPVRRAILSNDTVRWGVWLGRHIC